jgi:hypothetical protein
LRYLRRDRGTEGYVLLKILDGFEDVKPNTVKVLQLDKFYWN